MYQKGESDEEIEVLRKHTQYGYCYAQHNLYSGGVEDALAHIQGAHLFANNTANHPGKT